MIILEDIGVQFPTENSKERKHFYIAECECGTKVRIQKSNFREDSTCKSCRGKKGFDAVKHLIIIHGLSSHPLRGVYSDMKQRCYNPKHKVYINYGGRGITICDIWRKSLVSFYTWALANGYEEGLSIDRIDNDGNYEPINCRWTTRCVQSRNTRKLHKNNTSGYRGVSYHRKDKKYKASICVANTILYLGEFTDAIDGAIAYDNYVLTNNLEHTRNFNE